MFSVDKNKWFSNKSKNKYETEKNQITNVATSAEIYIVQNKLANF